MKLLTTQRVHNYYQVITTNISPSCAVNAEVRKSSIGTSHKTVSAVDTADTLISGSQTEIYNKKLFYKFGDGSINEGFRKKTHASICLSVKCGFNHLKLTPSISSPGELSSSSDISESYMDESKLEEVFSNG